MPMIAAPVAAWASGAAVAAGATAATAATIGAVAGSVAVGIVSGAVMGAASAALTGGDIFESALKGAAIGGITGGIASGAGILSGAVPAETQLAKFGLEMGAEGAMATAAKTPVLAETAAAGATASIPEAPVVAGEVAKETAKGSILNPETMKVLSGVGQGMAEAYGEQKAAETKAESDKELAEFKERQAQERIKTNIPGQFQARTAIIKIPDWWQRYNAKVVSQPAAVQTQAQQTGILASAGGV